MENLSRDIAGQLDSKGNAPLRLTHPETGKTFVVVSEELYLRCEPLKQPHAARATEQQALLRQVGQRAGWNASEMDAYDNYDSNLPHPKIES